MSPATHDSPDDLEQAQQLDELLSAIQAGDRSRSDALLDAHPELREWLSYLQTLDRFAAPGADSGSDETLLSGPRREGTVPASDRFGKYELLGEIGRGGMGVVYKARHPDLNRIVALKMIRASEWASAEDIARFKAEARAAARLRHRNIVGIYDVGEELGRPYFAMEFIEGQSLAGRLSGQPVSPDQAARWMISIARAVEHLHAQGILHRDLKPSNILLDTDGEPMVTDFGLAKVADADTGATRSGAIVGTPSYMSPEQAAGRNALVGIRSDIYSLGAILYEMLSGRPPFREDSPLDTLVQVIEGEPTLLRRLVPRLPPPLERICFQCLDKDPARRYASAAALADDLHRFLHGEPVEAQSGGPLQRLKRWTRRQPGLACRLAVLLPGTLIIQLYFLANGTDLPYHLRVLGLLGTWMGLSVLWQSLLNVDRLGDIPRLGNLVTDVSLLTALFSHAYDDRGTLIVIYALVIVTSGLWFQERLVWFATIACELGFLVLLVDRPILASPWHYPLLVLVTLAALGAATAFQVHRVRALSRYYERRPE